LWGKWVSIFHKMSLAIFSYMSKRTWIVFFGNHAMYWRHDGTSNMAISFSFSSNKWRRCRIFSENLLLGFASPPALFFRGRQVAKFGPKNKKTLGHLTTLTSLEKMCCGVFTFVVCGWRWMGKKMALNFALCLWTSSSTEGCEG
jgi:hypothetical protein